MLKRLVCKKIAHPRYKGSDKDKRFDGLVFISKYFKKSHADFVCVNYSRGGGFLRDREYYSKDFGSEHRSYDHHQCNHQFYLMICFMNV